jgi:hypothetical protein
MTNACIIGTEPAPYVFSNGTELPPCYLTERATMAYLSLSRSAVRKFGEEIGAVRKIGRSVRYDRSVIDSVLMDKETIQYKDV